MMKLRATANQMSWVGMTEIMGVTQLFGGIEP